MMLYEWANPTAAAVAAMLLFGDGGLQESSAVEPEWDASILEHCAREQGLTTGEFFAPPMMDEAAACGLRYDVGFPAAAARIGLNLGGRTYFSLESPVEEKEVGKVRRRRVKVAKCQAEGCSADLSHARYYHRRHKVCEFHSKASIVIAAGLSQRFCQQCSRFHELSEFDQWKRSCRKRLADHNRRRRKSQNSTTITSHNNSNSSSGKPETSHVDVKTNNNLCSTECNPESTVTQVSATVTWAP
ncbi:hypothetical protein HPP92_007209 [Vanilla planifolia]|uniref:SBP-type domain-containing protein n=1 Tax=Vanilla planifolia TaxID=51239 RepID=A0A835VBN1_VANPL|nr:hypothetical protein HPP92_007209 [Vanilla planifolia]